MAYRRKFTTRRPRKSGGRTGAKKIGKVRGRKNVYATKGFNKAVKRVIHRMAENKTITSDASNESITPCDGATAVPYFLNLIPPLQIGASSAERIGNQVRIVKNSITGYINLLPYNASTNNYACPIIVKMFLVSWKYANSQYTQPSLVDFSTFFQRGSATTNFIGNPLDMIRDVNTDVWTVHKTKQFELSSAPGWGAAIAGATYSNLSGVMSKKYHFNVGKYAKLLKFNDNIAPSRATNKNLYLVIQTVRADGTAVAANNNTIELNYLQECEYEDL